MNTITLNNIFGNMQVQQRHRTRLLMGCVFLFTCLFTRAQQVLLTDTEKLYPVAHPWYLEDRTGNLKFNEVIQQQHLFVRSELAVPDFLGNLSKVIWYKFIVNNNSESNEWFLQVKGGYLHHLTLFQSDSAGSIVSTELSADDEFEKKPVVSNDLVFPVALRSGQSKTFYLRASSRSLIRTSMSMGTMKTLYENSVYTSYGNGFLTALAAAMLIYNLFVYFSLKERVYLYYIIYIFLYIVHNNLVAGYTLTFFPWTGFLNSNLLLPLMGFASILFTNSFLQSQQYAPFIYRIRWLMCSLFIVPVALYFSHLEQLAIAVVSALMYALFVYWFAAGITAYRNSFRPAIYYIAGFGALITFNSIFGLKIVGVATESYWVDSALYIGTALESLILSFALANKINFYKKEKEIIQEQAYRQAVTFSHEMITMQETERKRIASELHDSVGQKLIVIKNKVLLSAKANGDNKQRSDLLAENVADVIQEIRSISYALRPYQMDLLGLTQSIKSLAEETFNAANIEYDIATDNIDDLFGPELQMNIYRIVQECLNNIVKHARASECQINISRIDREVIIRIEDNGIGFNVEHRQGGFGLRGIRERLHILKGTMTSDKLVPSGTVTIIMLPIS